MHELDSPDDSWDKKKIIIFLLIGATLIFGAYGAKVYVLGANSTVSPTKKSLEPAVEGASTTSENAPQLSRENKTQAPVQPLSSVRSAVMDQLETLKQQVTNINPEEIASSSPQVRKVLEDLKSIQQYPKNQAKEICQNICSSL